MIALLTGSRDWRDPKPVRERLALLPRGTVVRHGGARGLDQLGGTIARGLGFQVEEYPADWRTADGRFDRSAGARRSIAMLDDQPPPDVVLAWQLDFSRGTQITVEAAVARGLPIDLDSVETLIKATAPIGVRTVERSIKIVGSVDGDRYVTEPRYFVSIRNRSYYARHQVPIEAARRHYRLLRDEQLLRSAFDMDVPPPRKG